MAALCTAFSLVTVSSARVLSQSKGGFDSFEKIELLQPNGKSTRETDVRVQFNADSMEIASKANGVILKKWNYADIKAAEYSYTKNPRWKTGLVLGGASVLFPPLWFIAIPLGFSKHRVHWVTIRTDDDFAVLKLSKNNRKTFIPAFEMRSSVKVEGLADNK